jgi:hypothetical protein
MPKMHTGKTDTTYETAWLIPKAEYGRIKRLLLEKRCDVHGRSRCLMRPDAWNPPEALLGVNALAVG